MKKIIENIIPYPIDCEVRLGSVCAALLVSQRADIPAGMAICHNRHRRNGAVGEPCTRCGNCRGWTLREKEYFALANEYAFVTGQALLQFDMTESDPALRNEMQMLEKCGDYIDFIFRYAGYAYASLGAGTPQDTLFAAIKDSIDRGMPVLMQYEANELWLLVTGYDDEMLLYGYDGGGYADYYAKMQPAPDRYDGKLFCAGNWYKAMKRVVVVGDKCVPTVTLDEVIARNAAFMKPIFADDYYEKAAKHIMHDDNYRDEGENLRRQAQQINDFIGVPIGGRSIVSWFLFHQLDHACDVKYREMFGRIAGCCCDIHEICWVAWRAVGAYERAPERFISKLADPLYRKMLAGVVRLVGYKDHHIYESLRDFAQKNPPSQNA